MGRWDYDDDDVAEKMAFEDAIHKEADEMYRVLLKRSSKLFTVEELSFLMKQHWWNYKTKWDVSDRDTLRDLFEKTSQYRM